MLLKDQLDSSIEIVTPENIAFRYEVAGPFRRMPAFLIDLGIRLAVIFIVAFALGMLGLGFVTPVVLLLLYFVLEWFYGGLFETYWNGQTPGKRIMGIRVMNQNGQPINGMQAVMRNILRFVDAMPLLPMSAIVGEPVFLAIPTYLIGLVTPMFNRRFQRLGDLVTGTIVVIEDQNWLFGISKIEDPRAAQLAEYIPASFLINRQLSHAIATYVERRRFFSPARRREIAKHLAEPLLEQFRLPSDTSYDLMICALYHRNFIADQIRVEEDLMESIGQSPFRTSRGTVVAEPAPARPFAPQAADPPTGKSP